MNLEVHAQLSSNYRKHTAANPIQRALIGRFHRKIVAEIAALSPRSFLDAGCGEGFVAQQVLREIPGLELTGCDVSEAALAVAASANPDARFVPGSVVALPFADKSFDVVGCFEVMEHLPGDLPRQAHGRARHPPVVAAAAGVCKRTAARFSEDKQRPPAHEQ